MPKEIKEKIEDWEKEFNEMFGSSWALAGLDYPKRQDEEYKEILDEILTFIRQLLKSEKEKDRKEISKKRYEP